MDQKTDLKSIFEYDDYRQYLREFYEHSKSVNKRFSFRYFARLGGFKSGNILKIVMDGQINIVDETVEKFCKALKFNKEESHFFKNLVLFNQASNTEEKEIHSKELLRSRTFKKIYPLGLSQYRYFDNWYFPVVRGLVALPTFQEDPQWIAKKINPSITPEEAKRALDELLHLGLIARNSSGRLEQSNPTVSTQSAITSSSLAQYHKEMMKRAAESIDRIPREKRDLSAMTLNVSSEAVKMIKEMSEKFRKDIVEVAARFTDPEAVYQLNVYFFPITEVADKEK